ncbi:MAG: TVP38/TMEM64 family protein [Clostridia bacterium]|nr:TVP38/TMEM64 family protein [Clostridia bacterium]
MDKAKIKSIFIPIIKLSLITISSCLFFIGVYFILKRTGWIGKFSNIQELKTIILSSGFWSYCVFVVLQFLQVTILPMPAMVTTIVGVIIFGPFISFLLSTLAILLGSIFAYYLGKLFGIKLLYWAIGKDKTKTFQNKMQKGKYIFFLMMLFPFFPDDILCMLSGVLNMDFKFFLITNLITRPISLFCLCFVSTGFIIPFHSWGIFVWILLAIILLFLIIYSFKNKQKIEVFISKLNIKKN